jgi:MinD-like ATPase involved in chromosome partitioning or flagellar assembly
MIAANTLLKSSIALHKEQPDETIQKAKTKEENKRTFIHQDIPSGLNKNRVA